MFESSNFLSLQYKVNCILQTGSKKEAFSERKPRSDRLFLNRQLNSKYKRGHWFAPSSDLSTFSKMVRYPRL